MSFIFRSNMVIIRFVEYLKHRFNARTRHIETSFVCSVLLVSLLFNYHSWVEIIGTCAVIFTFQHASVANRLEEQENKRKKSGSDYYVSCYKKQTTYYYIKEILWLIYFTILGARSALIGVIIFLLYPYRRHLRRKHHPLD